MKYNLYTLNMEIMLARLSNESTKFHFLFVNDVQYDQEIKGRHQYYECD